MVDLSVIRFVICFVFLSVAVVSDLKTRKVPNELWLLMAPAAVVVLVVDLYFRAVGWRYYLILIPIGFFLFEALVERPPVISKGRINLLVCAWLMVPIITLTYMFYSIEKTMLLWSLISILVMMAAAFILYYFAILYGGADAKAVVVLAVLFPFYPEIQGITHWGGDQVMIEFMEVLFPFTFVILLNAAFLALLLPLYYIVRNLKRGEAEYPQMIFGYKIKIEEIEDSFVWPMEYYEGGKRKIKLFPRGTTDDKIESLKKRGRKRVWVSPKIPFLVFIFLGYLMSYIIGNPTLYLFDWILSLF